MGFIGKFLKIAIVLSFIGFVYRFIGLNWALISIVVIVSLYILYRIVKSRTGWSSDGDDGGYFAGLFED